MNKVQLNSKELKETLTHLIKNNRAIQEDGLNPIAISICGPAGLGKTSVVEQLAEELDIKHVEIINLAQLDELGDLVGIPIKEQQLSTKQDGKTIGKWVDEKIMASYLTQGWQVTNNSRMSYSKPAWIAGKGENGVLILDDYTRAAPRFMQAVMEIIDKQRYISWKLPKGWTILLTENPDDGTYNVSDIDAAAKSRYITFDMKWEPEVWAEWAEQASIDPRAINFTLLHGKEIIKDNNPHINPRSLVKFYNSLRTITDYSKQLPLIQNIGEGAVGPEVTTLFTSFIHNKLDKMITPGDILDTKVSFDTVKAKISELVKSGKDYRADLGYVLTTRLINHMLYTVTTKDITPPFIERVKDLITSECLGSDLKFVLAKKVLNSNNKFNVLMLEDSVIDVILE
jgi:hypothetical protein